MKHIVLCLIFIVLFEISYAKQPNNDKVKQRINLAESYVSIGELDKAYMYLQNAENLTTDKKQLAIIYEKMGEIEERKGHYTDALLCYTRSLILAKNLQYKELEDIVSKKISDIQSKNLNH